MKTVIIVQARMTSTRLPGKVLKTIDGKTLLEYLIERLRRVHLANAIVIATTTNNTDQPIVDLCQRLGVHVTRGSENDVLGRYHAAAVASQADLIVRVTSDCPLIDPQIIDSLIKCFNENPDDYDYVATGLERSYPLGMDAELLTFQALEEAAQESTATADREHVTPFIYHHPKRYRMANQRCEPPMPPYRLTVDTEEDFVLVEHIIRTLYVHKQNFTLNDIAALLATKPEWVAINANIEQINPFNHLEHAGAQK